MGRRTFASIGKPLDGRDNIVVTRDPHFAVNGVSVCATVADALTLARVLAATRGVDEMMIIGGAQIYDLTLPVADRIYLTEVHARPDGDRHFPKLDVTAWRETWRETLSKAAKDEYAATLIVYDRVAS